MELREALNDDAVRAEAAMTIISLVESVTIHPTLCDGTVSAEVIASTARLLGFATKEQPRLGGGVVP